MSSTRRPRTHRRTRRGHFKSPRSATRASSFLSKWLSPPGRKAFARKYRIESRRLAMRSRASKPPAPPVDKQHSSFLLSPRSFARQCPQSLVAPPATITCGLNGSSAGFLLLGNCFHSRLTGNGQNRDGRRGVRGSGGTKRPRRRTTCRMRAVNQCIRWQDLSPDPICRQPPPLPAS